MQTRLSAEQRAQPELQQIDGILRSCVHCGFCNATCPTYVLLGDELDGPRGRIYQIKSWLEEQRAPTASDAVHIDRCLSCLSCVTTCPSGVDYMHLIDFARAQVEVSPARSPLERAARAALARVLTTAWMLRMALLAGRLCRPFARYLPGRLRAMLALVPASSEMPHPPVVGAAPERGRRGAGPEADAGRKRVVLLRGCVQDTLRPQINAAARRVLEVLGCEVSELSSAHCCGALAHHLGQAAGAERRARATAAALGRLIVQGGADYIVSTASGCGTMLKDYAQVLRADGARTALAQDIAARTRDFSELVAALGGLGHLLEVTPGAAPRATGRVAVHAPCSIYHGQRLGDRASALLVAAGYETTSLGEAHLCCGSAGVYNLMQPELAQVICARKVALVHASGAQLVATANIGCLTQLQAGLLAAGVAIPVVHVAELLDAACGARTASAAQKSA